MTTEPTVPETMHIEDAALPVTPPVVSSPPAEPIESEPQERPRTQREIAMEQIAAARRVAIEKELSYGEQMADDAREAAGQQKLSHKHRDQPAIYDDNPGEGTDPLEAAAAQAATGRAAVSAPPSGLPEAPQAPGPETYRVVNVGGQQYRVTEEQYQQLAATGLAALEAVQREQQRPQAPPQPPQQPQQPQQPARRPAGPLLTQEETRALAPRLQSYNEAESAAALSDMTNLIAARIQAQNPQIDPQRVAQYAIQQATNQIRQEQAMNYNLSVIGQEYPEIFNNTRMAQLAALALHEKRSLDNRMGVQRPDLDLYREACSDVVHQLNLRPATPQPTASQEAQTPPSQAGQTQQPGMATRAEAKRAAPRSPIPAQRTQAVQGQGTRFPTASEIVASMKKARGQVV